MRYETDIFGSGSPDIVHMDCRGVRTDSFRSFSIRPRFASKAARFGSRVLQRCWLRLGFSREEPSTAVSWRLSSGSSAPRSSSKQTPNAKRPQWFTGAVQLYERSADLVFAEFGAGNSALPIPERDRSEPGISSKRFFRPDHILAPTASFPSAPERLAMTPFDPDYLLGSPRPPPHQL